ncbi:phospholipid-transporting ATPase ABCA3-like [Callithrix jacchus]
MCKTGKATIITSHSMEEYEALCARMATVAKGTFMCLGSTQHLKNKFGNMYTQTAKIEIETNEHKAEMFKEFIETTFLASKATLIPWFVATPL